MKILIVNTFDLNGGAARATYRLHRALLENPPFAREPLISRNRILRFISKFCNI